LQYFVYADDVKLVAKTSHTIKEVFKLQQTSKVGLQINEIKTNYSIRLTQKIR